MNGRAAYHSKRTNGTFRVVPEECAHFSLEEDFEEDESDFATAFTPHEGNAEEAAESFSQPLILNSAEKNAEKDLKKDVSRTSAQGGGKELSRLTDEVEIDGDSASDELDLLPPLPPSSRKFAKWNVPDLLCCKSRVPIKCAVM